MFPNMSKQFCIFINIYEYFIIFIVFFYVYIFLNILEYYKMLNITEQVRACQSLNDFSYMSEHFLYISYFLVFLHISEYFGISGVNNVVFPLMLQRFCVVLVLRALCYDRSATHVSVLAMT